MATCSMRSSFRRAVTTAMAAACCLAAAVPAHTTALAGPGARDRQRPAVTRVTVRMIEYRFVLSVGKARVRKVHVGTVVFTTINRGQLPHDFKIQTLGRVSRLVLPGRRAVLTVKFTKPGRYYYLCTVGAHAQYGMHGTLTVVK
jgi:plastocyanin